MCGTDFMDIILGRRSIRAYRPTPVDDHTIHHLLEAAMAAPSACGKDPWRFIVIRTKETLQQIAQGLPNGKMLGSAGAGIVVCGDIDAAHDRQISYLLQDCSAAIQNTLLAAHGNGLGACWLGVHPREDRIAHLRRILGIPEVIIPVSVISLGWPDETKEMRTRLNPSYVHQEKW